MSEPTQESVHSRVSTTWAIALGILGCAITISRQSFWIDEAGTAYKAAMLTFQDWWRSMRTETRGVVIAERRDELEERRLRIRECGWSRVPHPRAAAGRVAIEIRIVAMIAEARHQYRIGCSLAHGDAIGDGFSARGNAGDRRVVGALDRRSFRRELIEGDDVRRTDRRGFG